MLSSCRLGRIISTFQSILAYTIKLGSTKCKIQGIVFTLYESRGPTIFRRSKAFPWKRLKLFKNEDNHIYLSCMKYETMVFLSLSRNSTRKKSVTDLPFDSTSSFSKYKIPYFVLCFFFIRLLKGSFRVSLYLNPRGVDIHFFFFQCLLPITRRARVSTRLPSPIQFTNSIQSSFELTFFLSFLSFTRLLVFRLI